jgi:hypothetical protein
MSGSNSREAPQMPARRDFLELHMDLGFVLFSHA